MSKNDNRLTKNELKLKNEIDELTTQLNERLFMLNKTGIKIFADTKIFNDATENEFIGLSVKLIVYV